VTCPSDFLVAVFKDMKIITEASIGVLRMLVIILLIEQKLYIFMLVVVSVVRLGLLMVVLSWL
jgi:hypothetical protein